MKKAVKSAPHKWQQMRKRGERGWYLAYLRSHHWRRRRKRALQSVTWRCQECGYADPHRDEQRGTRLDVHHVSYAHVGAERDNELRVLCHQCHKKAHRLKG